MSFNLRVQNFRSHQDFSCQFSDTNTIVTGSNGSGKTTLIEAIYLAYVGKSWRSNFQEINRDDDGDISPWWRIDLTDTATEDTRTVKYQNGQKEFTVNDRVYKRLPASAHRPVILFEPNDMQLLYGSPSRRRQFLDRFIAQLEPGYQTELNKFERVLKQRNKLLKIGNYSSQEMLIWDIQFATLSDKISSTRRQYLRSIDKLLSYKYSEIANSNTAIKIKYQAGAPVGDQDILNVLQTLSEPVTPVGAQKDDYRFVFAGKDAKTTASRGENRTVIFAMLGVIADIARQHYGNQVLVLLDDIDSELDQLHRQNLYCMSSFSSNTIATTLEYHGDIQTNIDLG